jgi:hypothetical protein
MKLWPSQQPRGRHFILSTFSDLGEVILLGLVASLNPFVLDLTNVFQRSTLACTGGTKP